MLETTHFVDEHVATYATVSDFCKTFADEMYSLYLLAFLLTGDNDTAEKCLVYVLKECTEDSGVFREWTSPWIRLATIRHAIRLIRPLPCRGDSFSLVNLEPTAASAQTGRFVAIRALGAFERFVFVMSILEGWSEQDCAICLRCARQDVTIARWLALNYLGTDADYAPQSGEAMVQIDQSGEYQ